MSAHPPTVSKRLLSCHCTIKLPWSWHFTCVMFQLLGMNCNQAILLLWQAGTHSHLECRKPHRHHPSHHRKKAGSPWQQARSAGAEGQCTQDIFACQCFCVSFHHLKFSAETGAPSYQRWFLLFSTTDPSRPFYIAIWMFDQEVVRHMSLLEPYEQRCNHHFCSFVWSVVHL